MARISLVVAVMAGLILVSGSGGVIAAEPTPAVDAPVPRAWGWLVARRPSTFAYVPSALDQGNSGGQTNRVERDLTVGYYDVFFDEIGNGFYPIGVVTALSGDSRTCMIDDNFGAGVGDDPGFNVDCFDRDGLPADARFVANMVIAGDGPTGTLGYTWADRESTTDYTPSGYYSHVSSGAGSITVHRSATGSYAVTFPGLGRDGGNAQVSAAKGGPPALCKVLALDRIGADERVTVRCRDTSGVLVDADFMVLFTNRVGLTGVPGRKAAHLLADRPSAASYTPAARYRYTSAGAAPTIRRTAKGRYQVTLPGMPKGGSAQVTAYGAGAALCQVTSIGKGAPPQRIGVACLQPDGTPVDSRFLLSYTR